MDESQKDSHVLAVGNDERVFDEKSLLREKTLEYGRDFETLHVLCFSSSFRHPQSLGTIFFYPIFSRIPLFSYFLLWREGRKIIKKFKGQWIVSSDNPFELGAISWLLSLRARGRLSLQIHTDFLSPHFRSASLKERVRFALANFLVPRAQCVRVVSERIRRGLLKKFGDSLERKISLFPIFTEIKDYIAASRDKELDGKLSFYPFKIITVGRFLDKEKNHSMLIASIKQIKISCPDTLLAIVGYGPDRNHYEKVIEKNNLGKNVIIGNEEEICLKLGLSRAVALPSIYKSFDVFALSSNFEGWGRVVIEAMAAGLPVVMTDVGLAGEVIKDGVNGKVVPPRNSATLASALLEIYGSPETGERFKKESLRVVRDLRPATKEEYFLRYREELKRCIR